MKTLSRLFAVCFALALGLLAATRPAVAEEGYGYFRIVEGAATVQQAGAEERAGAEVNQPVLAGDHLWVPAHARVEIVLADQNILRVDGGSELILERLAASPDRTDRATVVRLLGGNFQLVVTQDSLGDELPRVETPNATIYPQYYGVYRITADDGYSQVAVRRGTAEVVTDSGTALVKADQEAVVDNRAPDRRADVREAGAFDSLERWGRQLDDEYAGVDQRYVDDNLRYAAAPLARYGAWINVNGSSYWQPRVGSDWRPYWQGRWAYTPVGLTWISTEPWGWVPYHYGSWDYLAGYGWVWQPGSVWAPAWVYWYWGQDYVGWCPTGYYTRYYGPELGVDVGFRSGIYGWAGGGWDLFDHWSFVSSSYFGGYQDGYRQGYRDGYWDGHRDVRRYAVPVDRRAHGTLGQGIITTDTRPLKPSVWKDPGGPLRALRGKAPAELPDVTPFVARKPLPPAVVRTVVAEKPASLDGTPLRPSTLGRPGRHVEAGRPAIQAGEPGKPGAIAGDRNPSPGQPAVREVPQGRRGRPAPEVDGGAPNPRVSGDRGDRNGRPATSEPSVRGGQPSVRERRPSPEADGGATRPERQPDVRGSRPPERQPEVRENRPPEPKPQVRETRPPERQPERQPQVRENRPPEPKPEVRENRRPEPKPENNDKKPPRSR